jgi:hypothetical protein
MIKFIVCDGEIKYPLELNADNTIFELKANVIGLLDVNFDEINIFLEDIGCLDDENISELNLDCLGLCTILFILADKVYKLFVYKLKDAANIWKTCCTNNILGFKLINQVGYYIDNRYPVCYACRLFCCPNKSLTYEILDKEFTCLCNAEQCVFTNCMNFTDNKKIIFENIHSILENHAQSLVKKEKEKLNKLKQEILARTFDFEKS